MAAFVISRIGESTPEEIFEYQWEKQVRNLKITNHSAVFEVISESLISRNIISDLNEIIWVAHRVVHGGQYFSEAVIIDDDVIEKMELLINICLKEF